MTDARGEPRLVVVGVGNRDRGDDGVGPLVCDLIGTDPTTAVRVVEADGSLVDLAMSWGPSDHVVVVDAAEPRDRPGRTVVVDAFAARMPTRSSMSTHGLGLDAAIELARALGRLPAELTVIAIEGASFETGDDVSPDVRAAAARLAERLRNADPPAPTDVVGDGAPAPGR